MRSSYLKSMCVAACLLLVAVLPAQAQTYAGILTKFDTVLPAYDYDTEIPTMQVSHDMALAEYLIATVRAGSMTEARVAADQLLATRKHGAATGWGLGFPWDAFSDGSTNRGDTVYGITVALAVRGLFDFYDATSEVKYRDAALDALAYYRSSSFINSSTGGVGGFFWYSNRGADQGSTTVHNVTAMLMGQYARAYTYNGLADYVNVVERCQRYLWARRIVSGALIYWPYQTGPGGAGGTNDPVHAAFIVQGWVDVNKYMTPLYSYSQATDYIVAQAAGMTSGVQRLWGAGQMIFTLMEAGKTIEANDVRSNVLPRFPVDANGYYGWATNSATPYVRHTSYLLAGLARAEYP